MFRSLNGFSLQQMSDRIEGYLSNHKPCINITPAYHEGGTPGHTHCPEGQCGDINGDETVDVLDVVLIVNVILGIGLIWINWRIYLVTEYIARSTNLLYKVIEEFMSVQRRE